MVVWPLGWAFSSRGGLAVSWYPGNHPLWEIDLRSKLKSFKIPGLGYTQEIIHR